MPDTRDELMQRCLELASRGGGYAAPNPLVGSVIVHQGEIISEGWHRRAGAAHAEREAILKIAGDPRLKTSVLYVNLEPCAHYGKTPPCADLIVEHGIPKVVYGTRDPFAAVDGRGIERLLAAGVEVSGPVLEKECLFLNRRFITFHTRKRPYIILKWAQSTDGFMAPADRRRVQISGDAARVLLHKWRSEEAAVLVGAGTAVADQPQLNIRFWEGKNPLRVFLDPGLKHSHQNGENTLVMNRLKEGREGNTEYIQSTAEDMIPELLDALYRRQILSVMVEGGADTIQRFMRSGFWDEIRILKSKKMTLHEGIAAPETQGTKAESMELPDDFCEIYLKA